MNILIFFKKEYLSYFAKVVSSIQDEHQSRELMHIINRYDYLFQIHDSIKDIYNTKKMLSAHYLEPKSDILLIIREISSGILQMFDVIGKSMESQDEMDIHGFSEALQLDINQGNRTLLKLLADPLRKDVGALTNFITYSQRLKDKLVNYAKGLPVAR
ncbi:hypothetical protein [Pseudohongiella nitratireducens]|uniref:hypothetical protein n=1 Tax=Pseudohongiella nitratireducens TaxID=1768907 RepID=UPI00083A787F|nr:hypothetical protein [Pseudohongiella nitratireducens]